MITKFKIFEKTDYKFVIGEYVWSIAFKKLYKVVDIDNRCLWVENENGYVTDFLKNGFIPEIEYNKQKYNI